MTRYSICFDMKVVRLSILLSNFPSFRFPAARFPTYEFHILGSVRDRYQFEESLFSSNGNAIFPNFHAARVFAKKLNDARDLVSHPERAVKTGQLNAMGLIDEIYHYIIRLYEESVNPGVLERANKHLGDALSSMDVRATTESFVALFPPLAVHKGKSSPEKYLAAKSEGRPNVLITLEELMMLYFTNFNPATAHMNELFTDEQLTARTKYKTILTALEEFFAAEPKFGPDNQALFDLLRAPMLAHPDSLEAQLGFIKKKWGMILSSKFMDRILGSMDLIEEENKIVFGGPGHPVVPEYLTTESTRHLDYGSFEAERFTADLDWMPRVVLLAKNTYVWLAQLSKKYQRSITRLDEIPDEELDQLARWNFTGLWLIGLWERSTASQKIKQWTGNPEAVPSAYSLYDYEIAWDLGGEGAFQNLSHRAWQRGIRLAGDMVPNHMGIYSKWIVEHPEYFIQSEYCPFPNYSFTGGNLSENSSVQLRIEDGYWSRRDAAVVFQRIDNNTGRTTYLYHGNDGTNMPWNDTAQLDLLKLEVREAVIQSIFHVARRFSIIRFDAAMTLTKKHFQRLWYPQPGTGGDIPSRADHALSKERFDEVFPVEFWREVVDRINQYMPGTLLLAEAFWLMEGYFVRTLGMHRVYNSAFMHMLMKEENENYRLLIKNTLEFNPEILKRYVNFMNNPDEQTAIAQFGKDDKYFGVAVMLVTLPGLPMFGHGQVEGFTEKYGMEYKRAYYDEFPDDHLVRRHEHEIFPIMRKRYLFSQVTHFELYDFHDLKGHANHNVFAYSNRTDSERALILYHNKYEECKGTIKWAVPKSASADGAGRKIERKSLGDALGINGGEKIYYIFKDYKSNLEYIRSGKELHEEGMYAELKAFQYQIFLDFREVYDSTGEYEQLARRLQGKGVPSVQQDLEEVRQAQIHRSVELLFSRTDLAALKSLLMTTGARRSKAAWGDKLNAHAEVLYQSISDYLHVQSDRVKISKELGQDIDVVRSLWGLVQTPSVKKNKKKKEKSGMESAIVLKELEDPRRHILLLSWLIADKLRHFGPVDAVDEKRIDIYEKIGLERPLQKAISSAFPADVEARRALTLLRILVKQPAFLYDSTAAGRMPTMDRFLNDYDVRDFIKVNHFKDTWFFNKESFQELLRWLLVPALVSIVRKPESPAPKLADIMNLCLLVDKLLDLSDRSGYQIEKLRILLSGEDTRRK